MSFASYNKYNNQIAHDAVAVTLINGITSLLVAVFAFATIGNIAWEQQEAIEDVITNGTLKAPLLKAPIAGRYSILMLLR